MPTPSPKTNQFLELAQKAQNDPSLLGELATQLQERSQQLETMRDEFLARAQSKGQDFLKLAENLINAALDGFDDYAEGLEQVQLFLDRKDTQALAHGIELIRRSTPQFMQALQSYGQAFLAVGGDRAPLINLLKQTLASHNRNELPKSTAVDTIETSAQFFASAAQEIEASPLAVEFPALTEKRSAQLRLHTALTSLAKAVQQSRPGSQQESMREIESAQRALEDAEARVFEQRFLQGPTPMPAFNTLYHCIQGYQAGTTALAGLENCYEWYSSFFSTQVLEFARFTRVPTDNPLLLEELPRAQELLDLHMEQLEELENSFESIPSDWTERACQTVTDLHRSVEKFQQAAQREFQVVCPKCGLLQEPVSHCRACSAPLPAAVGAASTFTFVESQTLRHQEPGEETVMTTHLARIFQTCQEYYEERIGRQEFSHMLEWAQGLVNHAESQLPRPEKLAKETRDAMTPEEVEAYDEQMQAYSETRAVFLSGLSEFRAGLEQLQTCLEQPQAETFAAAGQKIWSGAGQMQRAQRISDLANAHTGESPENSDSQEENVSH